MQWYKKKAEKAQKVAQVDLSQYKEAWEAYGSGVPFEQWMQANYPDVPMPKAAPGGVELAPPGAAKNLSPLGPGHQDKPMEMWQKAPKDAPPVA